MHLHTGSAVNDNFQERDVVEVELLDPEEALELQRELERFQEDALYFDAHRDDLLESYPEHWVAIRDRRVVAAAKTHQALLHQLSSLGIPAGRTYREFVCRDEFDHNVDLP